MVAQSPEPGAHVLNARAFWIELEFGNVLEEKKYQQSCVLFFGLNFNVFTYVDNRERAEAREKI